VQVIAALAAFIIGAVAVEPALLKFGEAEARLEVDTPDGKITGAVAVNGVGAVLGVEPTATGARVHYAMPKERFPQVLILRLEVQTKSGERVFRWAALPLVANANLKIETKPRATVQVSIGVA